MTLSELFSRIRHIQITSTRLADDLFAGFYHSAFKGRGMEFEEVREYQQGDDVRTLDWNVSARMNHPYVKTFREERDLTMMLMVDVSASARFGSHFGTKKSLIAEIAAVLAFSAIKNQDRVGLLLFSDIVEKYVPPQKGVRHVLRVIRELLAFEPKNHGTDLKPALAFLGKVQSRRAICFLISDFLCEECLPQIAPIAKRHDLISLCVTDPEEHAFPDIGVARFKDLETNEEILVDTSSSDVQNHFQNTMKTHFAQHKKLLQKVGVDFIPISTDQKYVPILQKFFKLRKMRRR